jgi:hypothetical protein
MKNISERSEALDFSPWTTEEMDLLASELAERLGGDGFDDPPVRTNHESPDRTGADGLR